MAITPDGKTTYVTNRASNTVTPIDVATNTPGVPIPAGSFPFGIAITTAPTQTPTPTPAPSPTPKLTPTPTPGLPTLPYLDAGTFVHFRYIPFNSAGQICTTSFAVTSSGITYELGAKHCIDNEAGDQRDNSTVAAAQPMNVLTSDDKFEFALNLNCSPGNSSSCLLPSPKKSQSGDMVAWRPATAQPRAMVQTPSGLLPVLGSKSWRDIAGKQVCHYGAGSATRGPAERCGSALSVIEEIYTCQFGNISCDGGTVIEPMFGTGGDSGGPAYIYQTDRNGKKLGVFAVGIVVTAGTDCISVPFTPRRCGDGTAIVPIETVLDRLQVRLSIS